VNSVVAVILGVMGGISGGVIRDLLLTRTPVVLTGEIYALAAGAGASPTFCCCGRRSARSRHCGFPFC
jgi:uncharacterized membrane protein YeiH